MKAGAPAKRPSGTPLRPGPIAFGPGGDYFGVSTAATGRACKA